MGVELFAEEGEGEGGAGLEGEREGEGSGGGVAGAEEAAVEEEGLVVVALFG